MLGLVSSCELIRICFEYFAFHTTNGSVALVTQRSVTGLLEISSASMEELLSRTQQAAWAQLPVVLEKCPDSAKAALRLAGPALLDASRPLGYNVLSLTDYWSSWPPDVRTIGTVPIASTCKHHVVYGNEEIAFTLADVSRTPFTASAEFCSTICKINHPFCVTMSNTRCSSAGMRS